MQVIEAAERDGVFEQLVLYLRMARVEVKEAIIENELIYSLAKTNALGDLEEIIAAPNVANIEVRRIVSCVLCFFFLKLFFSSFFSTRVVVFYESLYFIVLVHTHSCAYCIVS